MERYKKLFEHGSYGRSILAVAGLLVLLVVPGTDAQASGDPVPPNVQPAALCLNFPTIDGSVTQPRVPGDSSVLSQAGFHCFGWSEFIALNWPAGAPGIPKKASFEQFGEPGDLSPGVWETFMDVHGVMRPGAAPPIPWGSGVDLPEACREHASAADKPLRVLRMTSKFHLEFDATDDVEEAAPGGNPNWLADRDGNLVFYEILMNRVEYNYFVDNRFYDADIQHQAVTNGTHVDFPKGVVASGKFPGKTGAIEIKAAWLTLPEGAVDKDPKWKKSYKLSEALIYDPQNPKLCARRVMALVGLHILHKTTTQPQWTWATFEHKRNTPDLAEVEKGKLEHDYLFYNPHCKPKPVSESCQTYSTSSCTPLGGNTHTECENVNVPPPFCLKLTKDSESDFTCLPEPVQVARVHPIPDTLINPARTLNRLVHEALEQVNPDSVFLNYDLVSVLWSDSAVDENQPGEAVPTVPLSLSGLRPTVADLPLANTMMETYVQDLTCQSCHSQAAIAASPADESPTFGADYSFIVQMAQSSSATSDATPPCPSCPKNQP